MTAIRTQVSAVLPIGIALALVALAWLCLPINAAAQGWLLATAIWSGLPTGALALLLIHRLTGGAWGDALLTSPRRTAALMVMLSLAVAVLALAQWRIYPWSYGSVDEDVGRLYLNAPFFTLRLGVIVCGWLFFAIAAARGQLNSLVAGLGLSFYGLSISVASIDWFLSLAPHHAATTFGAIIGLQNLLSALAVAVLLSPVGLDARTKSDLGGLLFTLVFSVLYLELMTYVAVWYGDLPEKVDWYVARNNVYATSVMIAGAVAGLAALILLMLHLVRASAAGLRIGAGLTLLGVVCHWTWLLVPDMVMPGLSLVGAVLILLALTLVSAWTLRDVPQSTPPVPSRPVEAQAAPAPRNILLPQLLHILISHVALSVAEGLRRGDLFRPRRGKVVESFIAQQGNDTCELEPMEIEARRIALIGVGFLGSVAVAVGALSIYFVTQTPPVLFPAARSAPQPSLAFPVGEADRLRNAQTARLSDARSGTIEGAMQAIAARGTRAYDPLEPSAQPPREQPR